MAIKISCGDYVYSFVYRFSDFGALYPLQQETCYFCGRKVSVVYSHLIRKLKNNMILDEDYRMRDCACDFILNHNEGMINCIECGQVLSLSINFDTGMYYIECSECHISIKQGNIETDRKTR